MYCPNCGKSNSAGAKYCIHCGAKLENISSKQNFSLQNSNSSEKKSEGSNWSEILGWGLLIAFIIFVIYSMCDGSPSWKETLKQRTEDAKKSVGMCWTCGGSGYFNGKTCPSCNGTGKNN